MAASHTFWAVGRHRSSHPEVIGLRSHREGRYGLRPSTGRERPRSSFPRGVATVTRSGLRTVPGWRSCRTGQTTPSSAYTPTPRLRSYGSRRPSLATVHHAGRPTGHISFLSGNRARAALRHPYSNNGTAPGKS